MKKKLFASLIALLLLCAFITPAYAYSTSSIGTNQSADGNDYWHAHGVTRSYSSFSLNNPTPTTTPYIYPPNGNATKLTVRAYKDSSNGAHTSHTRISNAKTYKAGSLSGGQAYWSTPEELCIKCNNNSQGDWIWVVGNWLF